MRGLSDYLSRLSARCDMFFATRFQCTQWTDPDRFSGRRRYQGAFRQPSHEPGKLRSKQARFWPGLLLTSLVSLARLLTQPCHEPGKRSSRLARLWPCHLLASLVLLARLLRPCHKRGEATEQAGETLALPLACPWSRRRGCSGSLATSRESSRESWRGSGLATCWPPWSRLRGCSGSLATSRGSSRASWRGSGLATCLLSWSRWRESSPGECRET